MVRGKRLPEIAISIRQPYAELILLGKKKAEFRSRRTRITGPVLIYASLRPAESVAAWKAVKKEPGSLPVGRIVGMVEVAGCKWDERRKCYAYALKHPRRLRSSLEVTNRPSPRFWRPKFRPVEG